MKKMIIAIAVLAAVAFTAYLGLQAEQSIPVKLADGAELIVQIDSNGDVVGAQYVYKNDHRTDDIVKNGTLVEKVTNKPKCMRCNSCRDTGCYYQLCRGFWMCAKD